MARTAVLLLLAGCSGGPAWCAAERELKDESGKTIIRYVVEAPESIAPAGTADPRRQVGLILCFPEHDRPVGDEILPVRESLRRLGISDGYVLVAGGPQARKFGPADHEPIAQLIAWAKKTYPINPRRVYMYGKGEGGKISGEFAMLHPELVTASITYSWGWWTMPAELKEAIDPQRSAPEFYMVLGLRDLSHHITTVRDAYSRVNAKGYHVIYREFDDLGARTYHPASNDDAVAWVTRLRNKNIPPSTEERKLLERYGADSAPAAGPEGFYADLALVGGAPAGAVVQRLLASGGAAVRAAAAETCSRAIFDEETIAALSRSLSDPAAKVRRSAIRALAANANWRSAAAQQALIQLATGVSTPVEAFDRIAAADGIVQAVRFQIKGVRQDPAMFQALVMLLDAKDEELRVMAANALAPIRDADFRGDLGRPERKSPDGGWQNWLGQVTTKAAGYLKDYEVCGWGGAPGTSAVPGNRGTREPVDLFCMGGAHLLGYNLATKQPAAKDPAKAFQYTLQASEQGYREAAAAVGMMYAVGKGVPQDYAQAAKWLLKAAEQGHVLAASNLSMLYRGTPGVPSNPVEAERWTKFAALHSSPQQAPVVR
ncbi:MAG TPA: hypothetical protein VMZ52_19790 [Bryobacteraceae bacterium]|nr:hypothetical protein [Bryobacteraceae bacterium]